MTLQTYKPILQNGNAVPIYGKILLGIGINLATMEK